jgi:hypothetical protein
LETPALASHRYLSSLPPLGIQNLQFTLIYVPEGESHALCTSSFGQDRPIATGDRFMSDAVWTIIPRELTHVDPAQSRANHLAGLLLCGVFDFIWGYIHEHSVAAGIVGVVLGLFGTA